MKKIFLLFFILAFSGLLFSVDAQSVRPLPEPGIYPCSQLIAFAKPEGTRLLARVDDGPLEENVAPIFLSVERGSAHRFIVKTELHSLLPNSPIIESGEFSWVIDMQSPPAPTLSSSINGSGRTIVLNISEPSDIYFQMFHPFSGASNSGMLTSGSSVYLPEGASLCAWAIDGAGNRGQAVSAPRIVTEERVPFRVISPVSGTWANPQMLVIDKDSDADVVYSIDGSDPAVSGLVYTGPVLLSDTKITTVRFLALSSSGKKYSDQVRFAVVPSSVNPTGGFSADGSLVETGEFMELHMGEGFVCSTGNSVTQESGVKELVFSAVRGMRLYYPVTVTDGNVNWRWICASGNESIPLSTAAASAPDSPIISILDWYFVDIRYSSPIYYSVDNSLWSLCDRPIFIDRSSNHVLAWYSDSWKGAEVQKISLPAKPQIQGIPATGLTANPVFLSAPGSPFAIYYRGGNQIRVAEPDVNSAELGSGLLVEVPKGIESDFSFRFLAVYDGLVHGEIDESFTIDRKPPRSPTIDLATDRVYSRTPVTITPAGEDMIQCSVFPEPYYSSNRSIILEGSPSKSIDYTITLFSVDRAGNQSPSTVRRITVNLDALFIDASADVNVKRDGSPTAPFDTLDAALDSIRGKGKWRVYVKGKATLSQTHTITTDVTIIGDAAEISQNPAASIILDQGSLAISGCKIRSVATHDKNGTFLAKSESPLFDLNGGNFLLSNSELTGSGNNTVSLVRSNGTDVSIRDSLLSVEAFEYASLIESKNSEVRITSSSMIVSARNASALSLTSSTAEVSDCTIGVFTVAAARAVESWSSSCSLRVSSITRYAVASQNLNTSLAFDKTPTDSPNKDTAVWYDLKSRLIMDGTVKIEGFWRKSEQGK